jgi:hypothetical protein
MEDAQMKLKMTTDGKAAEVKDGMPVYVDDAGHEIAYDVPAAQAKIVKLNSDERGYRKENGELKARLEAFGDLDPEKATKALQLAESMAGKKALDDEGLQKMITAAVAPVQKQLEAIKAESEKTLKEKEDHIYKLEVSQRFTTSDFLKNETTLGEIPDMAEAYFGKAFKIEGGRVVAYDGSGQQIFSKIKPGEPAGFDEALSELVQKHPKKDHILRSKVASGSGSDASNKGGAKPGATTIRRTDFEQLNAGKQMEFAKSGGVITD